MFAISTTRRSRTNGDASRARIAMTDLIKLPTWADEEHIYAVVETPRELNRASSRSREGKLYLYVATTAATYTKYVH